MRILINTATTYQGGGVQVACSLIQEARKDTENNYIVAMSKAVHKVLGSPETSHCTFIPLAHRPAERLIRFRNPATDLQKIEKQFAPDVVLTTSGPSYWRPKAPHLMGFNLPHFLYPESPYFSKVLGLQQRMKWKIKEPIVRYFSLRDADAWFVQTEDVNRRLKKWLKRTEVHTISNTVSSVFTQQTIVPPPDFGGSASPFRLLVLSAFHRHKNLNIVDQVCDLFRELQIKDIRFVMTLKDDQFAKIISKRNRHFVENLGVCSPQDCPNLYKGTHALFLPTLLECFTASYVEAMAMRRPIVTTNLGFATTICGDAGLYFPPLDARAAVQRVLELKESSKLYHKLIEAGSRQLVQFGNAEERFKRCIDLCVSIV